VLIRQQEGSVAEILYQQKDLQTAVQPRCKVAVVVPAYNEDRLIGSVVIKARRFASDVIVVDDGSTDQTARVAAAAGAMVVSHPANQGKGAALNTGLQVAQALKPDAVVLVDGDGQHRAREIPLLAAAILCCTACDDGCQYYLDFLDNPARARLARLANGKSPGEQPDIVIGSRYLENRGQVPTHRRWGHRVFNWLTRGMAGVGATDSQSGFRVLSRRALDVLAFSSKGFSVESEMQFIAHEHGLRLAELPVKITYYEKPKRNVMRHGFAVLNGLLKLVGQYRPLLFFGFPGLLIILLGFAWGIWVVDIFLRTGGLAVGYAMISILLSMVGLVSFSTGIILHSVRGLLVEMLKKNGYLEKNQ